MCLVGGLEALAPFHILLSESSEPLGLTFIWASVSPLALQTQQLFLEHPGESHIPVWDWRLLRLCVLGHGRFGYEDKLRL